MNLNRTLICIDCDEILDAAEQTCPKCAGTVLYPIAKWIESVFKRGDGHESRSNDAR